MVQVDQALADGEVVCIPDAQLFVRFCNCFATHYHVIYVMCARGRGVRRLFQIGVVLAMACVSVAAGDEKKDDRFNCYSLAKEIALGKQLAGEVERQAKLVDDPIITEYVNRMGQNLARHSDAKFPFTFRVIQDPVLNAFALPGGYVFVNTGLLVAAETESEMASAMAHEIAHVAARHMTRQACRSRVAGIASLPLIFLGGWAGYAAQQAIPMALLSFSRGFEEEADYLGLQYLYAAGYDPTAAIDLFEKMMSLQARTPGALTKVFSTHPMNEDRLKKAQAEIQRILPARAEYVLDTSEYAEVRGRWLATENQRRLRPPDKEPVRLTLQRAPGSGSRYSTQ